MHSLFRLWQYVPMLLILLISSLAYVGVQNYLQQNSAPKINIEKHEPLYTMKNPVFYHLDIAAQNMDQPINQSANKNTFANNNNKINTYQIKAEQALQYEDDKNYTLNNVRIEGEQKYSTNNNSKLQILAKQADMDAMFDTLNLSAGIIDHAHFSGKKMHIDAQNVLFYPKLDQMQTKNKTHIRQTLSTGKIHLLEADNMYFDNISYNLDLKGHIKGSIE
jgi:Lipopolysaccharide-assembly, LptC-related